MEQSVALQRVIIPAGAAATVRAVGLLQSGQPIGLPTETVYGLAADATNDQAVARIFALKDRPSFNPLIVHVANLEGAEQLVEVNATARALATAFWPGALTLVLPRREDCAVSLLASAGPETLAVRVPGHLVAQDVLGAFGNPLAAPSANRSGQISPTTARHVADDLPLELVIDGGPCPVGVESTILRVEDDTVTMLRPGGIGTDAIEHVIGTSLATRTDKTITAPGQLSSHYAPTARLRLSATDVRDGEALLAFGPPLQTSGPVRNLSPGADMTEAAANLFAMLRALDKTSAETIAVMPIPETGLGVAINDRLRRAAAPRPDAA